jgi:methanogenic corrinoid protein MtbC1
MSEFDEIRANMSQAIRDGDADRGAALARQAVEANIPPTLVFAECIAPTLADIGDKFSRMEIFLPEMTYAADTVKAIFEVFDPVIKAQKSESVSLGKVVIGTVSGDVHDIGKNMLATLLEVNGFEVINLGCNVPVNSFLTTARQQHADIIAMSSLLTTSLPYMKDLLAIVKETGEDKNFKIMVGGGPVTADWAQRVGANGYGKDAAEAVAMAKKLVNHN